MVTGSGLFACAVITEAVPSSICTDTTKGTDRSRSLTLISCILTPEGGTLRGTLTGLPDSHDVK